MRKTKKQTSGLLILLLIIGIFTYHWGLTTLNDQWRSEREYRTHSFVLDSMLEVNGSTGIMIKWDDSTKTGYVLTCAHVVERHIYGPISIIRMVDSSTGQLSHENGEVWYYDQDKDLAIVAVKTKYPLFTIIDDVDYKEWVKPGLVVWSAGNPTGDTGGQMLTVGHVIDPTHSYNCPHCEDHEKISGILHDATTWYGFSGGPLIEPQTNRVIGLNFRLGPHHKSDTGMAVPAPVINQFLKECKIK